MDWAVQVLIAAGTLVVGYFVGRWKEGRDEINRAKRIAPLLADALQRDILALSELAEQLENLEGAQRNGFRFEPDGTYIDAIADEVHLIGPGAPFVVSFHQQIKTMKADLDALNVGIRQRHSPPDFSDVSGVKEVIASFDKKVPEVQIYIAQLRRWASE